MSPIEDEAMSGPHAAEPHGRAALLIVESLIHELIARSMLSVTEAVYVVEVARDTQIALTSDARPQSDDMRRVLDLLSALHASLSVDLPRGDDVADLASERLRATLAQRRSPLV